MESESAVLMASEVVTQAVLEADSEVTLTVQGQGTHLRVEVHEDGSSDASAAPDVGPSRPDMLVLERAAEDWGEDVDSRRGKTTWFEVSGRPCRDGEGLNYRVNPAS